MDDDDEEDDNNIDKSNQLLKANNMNDSFNYNMDASSRLKAI